MTISTASASDDGDYTVTVTSQTGSTVSKVASLSIQPLPEDAPLSQNSHWVTSF